MKNLLHELAEANYYKQRRSKKKCAQAKAGLPPPGSSVSYYPPYPLSPTR